MGSLSLECERFCQALYHDIFMLVIFTLFIIDEGFRGEVPAPGPSSTDISFGHADTCKRWECAVSLLMLNGLL